MKKRKVIYVIMLFLVATVLVLVVDKKISQINIDDENTNVLVSKEIVITNFYYRNDGFDDIRFGDLTVEGKINAVIALFVPSFRVYT